MNIFLILMKAGSHTTLLRIAMEGLCFGPPFGLQSKFVCAAEPIL